MVAQLAFKSCAVLHRFMNKKRITFKKYLAVKLFFIITNAECAMFAYVCSHVCASFPLNVRLVQFHFKRVHQGHLIFYGITRYIYINKASPTPDMNAL